jgi:hypothetical protein
LQIRTIEQLLTGQAFDHPPTNVTLAQAGRIQEQEEQQMTLDHALLKAQEDRGPS